MIFRLHFASIFSLLLVSTSSLFAQIDDQFWFAIPKETANHGSLNSTNNVSFKITAMELDAKVKISMPVNSSFVTRTFTVPAGKSHVEILATDWAGFEKIYANPTPLTTVANSDSAQSGKTSDPNGRGILIESDNKISVYYDYDNTHNRQLFSLKGRNALGTDFYTPFQNIWTSYTYARSEITIVATEDNTVIHVEPTVIFNGRSNLNAFDIVLNKGETYSLVSKGYKARTRPAGTHIYVRQDLGSGGKIAVTVNDDSVQGAVGGCYDIIGDQIVPTNILGLKYLVMCGYQATKHNTTAVRDSLRGEQIFVVATQPGTVVTFQDTSGLVLQTSNLNAKGVDYMSPNVAKSSQNAIFVNSNKPIYVFHITGIDCEMGGALLPPITDCTGSPEVTFYRSGTVANLTLNLMIPYDVTKPFDAADQSYKFFRIYYEDGTSKAIDPTWFEPIRSAGWAALKFENRDMSTAYIPINQAVKIVNEKDMFHLGITNGRGLDGSTQTNKYGYFSSYNTVSPSAVVAGVNVPAIVACFGDTVILKAYGALKNGYTWHYGSPTGPPTYLSDYKSATPRVFCPPGVHNFHVTIHLAKCFGDATLPVTVFVQPEVKAAFKTDTTAACAPLRFKVTNTSTGGNIYEWTIKKDNDPEIPFTPPSDNSFMLPNSGFFQNNTAPYTPNHYIIKLKTSIDYICKDSLKKEVTIYPQIKANFLPLDTVGCHPVLTTFRNLSSGNVTDTSYTWNFGDGNSTNEKNPKHSYENFFGAKDTVYKVNLVAVSPYYCTDTAKSTLTVHPYIKANFVVDTVKGCSPLTVKIKNTSLNKKAISEYIWDFGDGTPPRIINTNQDTLMHTYPVNISPNQRSYKLLLTVKHKYKDGCPDTISRQMTVYPQTALSAINIPNSVCDSTVLNIVTKDTTAHEAISSYFWDFGDGSTSTDKNPSHLFRNLTNKDKTYKVKLTGLSKEYCNGYASKDIVVHALIDPQFAVNVPTNCAPFDANIKNNSRGGITSYKWTYGDGGVDYHSVADTIHRYTNTDSVVFSRQIKLTVTNSGGCTKTVAQSVIVNPEIQSNFSLSDINGCNPLRVNLEYQDRLQTNQAKYFLWDFGDNSSSSTGPKEEHEFTNTTTATVVYPIKLTVTSKYSCTAEITKNVSVYPYIIAEFTVDSVKGCSPYKINIHNSSRGGISQYSWTYGDGINDNHSSIDYVHTYYNNSTINSSNLPIKNKLILKASKTYGNLTCWDADTATITVYPEVEADFTTNVKEGCNPLKVEFTNKSGPDNSGVKVPVDYKWFYGDNATGNTPNTSHEYNNITSSERIYKSQLIAYSIYKCSDTANLDIKVYPLVDAGFTYDDAEGCSPHTIKITNASSPGCNRFNWMFDDGSPISTAQTPIPHVYRNLGTANKVFKPRLIASYNGLCSDTVYQKLTVYPEVIAGFKQDTLKGCHPLEINFTDTSKNAKYYSWVFGDDGTSGETNPKHTYVYYDNKDTVYNLSLTVRSTQDCKSTYNKKVYIYSKPKAKIYVNNTVNCPPFLLPIENQTEGGFNNTYYWSLGDGEKVEQNAILPLSHKYDNLTDNTVAYDLKLFVESYYHCTDQINQSIKVHPRVVADFTPDISGCSPLLVSFTNKTLRASSYVWTFEKDITNASVNAAYKFFNNSLNDTTFKVQLVGYSKFGCTDTAHRSVTVHPQPIVRFLAQPTPLFYPDARVNLLNQTNEGYWNYLWNFDDGVTLTDKDPGTHEFMKWGLFNLKLKAWNDYCSDSAVVKVEVKAPNTIADFDVSDDGCVPLTVNFTNHSTWATSYKWEFDDGSGSTSTEINPSHVYQEPGKYQIKLTTYGDGAQDVTYREVVVYPKPEVKFDLSPRYVMLPEATVHYYNTSKLGYRYKWEFGDGDTSDVFEPSHTYRELGLYDITLNVWTEHQCFDSVVMPKAVKVDGKGVIQFPNAFKPSTEGPGDGKYTYPDTRNTVFHPYHDGVKEYKLEIYDRWGELLFESKDVNIGWDGYYKGELCKSDVYIWKAKGKFYNGSNFNKAGDVTILR